MTPNQLYGDRRAARRLSQLRSQLRMVLVDEEGVAPTAWFVQRQPVQQRCSDRPDQNNEHPMPQSQPPAALAHVVQQGRCQQVVVMVLLSPQSVENIQAVALVTARHPQKKLDLGWSQVFAYQAELPFRYPSHQSSAELADPIHLETQDQTIQQTIRRPKNQPQDADGQDLINYDQ